MDSNFAANSKHQLTQPQLNAGKCVGNIINWQGGVEMACAIPRPSAPRTDKEIEDEFWNVDLGNETLNEFLAKPGVPNPNATQQKPLDLSTRKRSIFGNWQTALVNERILTQKQANEMRNFFESVKKNVKSTLQSISTNEQTAETSGNAAMQATPLYSHNRQAQHEQQQTKKQ